MTEAHVTDDLAAYALDALDEDEVQAVESHLRRCPACRAELAGHQRVADLLRADAGVSRPPAQAWDNISAGVAASNRSRAQATGNGKIVRLVVGGWVATAVGLAASFAAILFVGLDHGADNGVVALANRSDDRVISLAPVASTAASAQAKLFVDSNGKDGGLVLVGAPANYDCQVLFIRRDQTRVDGGTFRVGPSGSAVIRIAIPGAIGDYEGVAVAWVDRSYGGSGGSVDLLAGPIYETTGQLR